MDAHHGITFANLYNYYLGHTDEHTSREVEVHLASCLACREMLRVMALLSGTPIEDLKPSGGDHPLLEELMVYYRAPASLSPDMVKRFESHLLTCADCRSELTFLQELEAEMHAATTVPPQDSA